MIATIPASPSPTCSVPELLELARERVEKMLDKDPDLEASENARLKAFLQAQNGKTQWSKIS